MKSLLVLLLISFNLFAKTAEQELLNILIKTNSSKEITNTKALCNEYQRLYNTLDNTLKLNYESIICRTESVSREEVNTQKMLDTVSKHEQFIQHQEIQINNYQNTLIVDYYKSNN